MNQEIQQTFWNLEIGGKKPSKKKKVAKQVKMSEELAHLIDSICEEMDIDFSFGTRLFWWTVIKNRREFPGMFNSKTDPMKELNVGATELIELLPMIIKQYETKKMEKMLDKTGVSLYK